MKDEGDEAHDFSRGSCVVRLSADLCNRAEELSKPRACDLKCSLVQAFLTLVLFSGIVS